jgi:hypothetical protein
LIKLINFFNQIYKKYITLIHLNYYLKYKFDINLIIN